MSTSRMSTDTGHPVTGSKRPLTALVAANYLSWIGNTMTLVAVPLYVLDISGSATQAGAAGFANALPMIIAGLAGGVVTDRVGPRRTSVAADLAAGVCMAAVPALHGSVGLALPVLMALLFLRTLADAPGAAARLALLPQVTNAAGTRPETANSLFHSAQRVAYVVGPPAAALMAGLTGPAAVLYVDAATFLVSALLIVVAVPRGRGKPAEGAEPAPEAGAEPAPRPGFLREVTDGGRFILRTPVLGAIISVVVVTNFLDDALTPVLLPVYSREVLHDADLVGWLLAANGIGAVAGSFGYAPASRRLLTNRWATFVGCFGLVCLARLCMIAQPGLWLMLLVSFAIGLASGPINPLVTGVVTAVTPESLLGRVWGAVMAMAFAVAPLGIFLTGWLADHAGLTATLTIFGGLYCLLILYALTNRALRGLGRTTGTQEQPLTH
ncbi:MFS transporter [Streptomyces sclerotialus]|uniref:MFS transporter n=1 Tax=Streptomyces sclerotialus TaxID=1957 RepID=UPI000691CA2F